MKYVLKCERDTWTGPLNNWTNEQVSETSVAPNLETLNSLQKVDKDNCSVFMFYFLQYEGCLRS